MKDQLYYLVALNAIPISTDDELPALRSTIFDFHWSVKRLCPANVLFLMLSSTVLFTRTQLLASPSRSSTLRLLLSPPSLSSCLGPVDSGK